MTLLNNDILSVLTQYIDDNIAPVVCDVMGYDTSKYNIKRVVDITTYKPSDGVISKVYWDPLLNRLPHTFYVVCRLDDYLNAQGAYHEVELGKGAKVCHDKILYRNKRGELHRIGGPAVVWNNGRKVWFENGKLHRIGGPAVVMFDDTEEWYENGVLHRVGGPAVSRDNCKFWYEKGKLHRVDGPAVEANKCKYWYTYGKLLRKEEKN